MKFVEPRPFANPDVAARKLVEIASTIEPVQNGRIYARACVSPRDLGTKLSSPVQLPQRQRMQQDPAWHHEGGGQHIRISAGGADARHIRNDQLEAAGRGDRPHGDRDGEVGEAENIPDDRALRP